MYATEYDLLVAQDKLTDRRNEMKAIRMAQAVQGETAARPSLLDRLMALTARGTLVRSAQGKVGAAA